MSVPGIMNPFARPPYLLGSTTDSRNIVNALQEKRWLPLADGPSRPHPSTLPPPVPLARKRGWQPSCPEPSPAVTVTTSTTGHLNVHPRYHDTTVTPEGREEDQGLEMADGAYFCIVDCTYALSFEGSRACTRAPLFTANNTIRMHVAVLTVLFAHGRHGQAMHNLHTLHTLI
jgi:hypothetical protein